MHQFTAQQLADDLRRQQRADATQHRPGQRLLALRRATRRAERAERRMRRAMRRAQRLGLVCEVKPTAQVPSAGQASSASESIQRSSRRPSLTISSGSRNVLVSSEMP
jgi:hypothetical protein